MERKTNIISGFLIIACTTVLIVWAVTALTNGDPLWFLRSFSAPADWITIYWEGETTMLLPGDPGYDEIMAAFTDGIANWSGYEGGVGISEENMVRYREEWHMLELHYNDPVQVHTSQPFGKARNFYIPLSGTHGHWRRVFGGLTDVPRVGVLNMDVEHHTRLVEAVANAVQKPIP